jgi:EAL domain-containing protein (putative c-di-GMP-specific phosphodiesterase class I)/GGDEF domain-containing protein
LSFSFKRIIDEYRKLMHHDVKRYAHTPWFKGVLKEFDQSRYSFLFWTLLIGLFIPLSIGITELVIGSYGALWKIALSEAGIAYLFFYLVTKKNTALVGRIVLGFMPLGYLLSAFAPRTYGSYAVILVSLPLILSNLVFREKKIPIWILYYVAAILLGIILPFFGLANNWRMDYDTKTIALFHLITLMVTFVSHVMSFSFMRILYGAVDRVLQDETTGLPSIHVFHEDIRDHDRFVAGILRIGNFKEITTLFGYEFSEAILIETAAKLKNHLSVRRATAYRLNNYDFGFLMPASSDTAADCQACVRILYQQMLGPISCHGKNIEPAFHIGYTLSENGGKESCLNEADLALKRGLEEHEPVVAYSEAIDDRLKTEAMIGQLLILSRNIKEGKLAAYHQRIVALCAPQSQSWNESLLRIWDFQSEYHAPAAFLPLLRSTGYDRDISDFMVDHAERYLQTGPGWLSINVTSKDLLRTAFMAQAGRVARLSLERGGRFILELLESDIMGARDDVLPALNEFRASGGLVAMDDFGSGYSNFGKLLSFPLDIVKFDGEFVRMSYVNSTARSLLERVARSLAEAGILTVAEFVETEQQADMLREIGINYGQGFLWSKPAPASDEAF